MFAIFYRICYNEKAHSDKEWALNRIRKDFYGNI